VSKLRFIISMSLDGYVAGPQQSVENPLGIGGERLHSWAFELAAWRAPHGLTGGVVKRRLTNVGATVMGRNMFGGHPGAWKSENPWNGWWGAEPPFHHPVFVLTHHAREPLRLKGTTFTFVTDGIESALDQAKRAGNGKDVALAGGASAAQQYLDAGLVDEMDVSVAPILLGGGERLFDNVGDDLHGLSLVDVVGAPGVAHLRFVR
jgi:dihydrofolate reductase